MKKPGRDINIFHRWLLSAQEASKKSRMKEGTANKI